MSITSSYNKHTGIRYAYDTTYVWDEAKHKKVQKKRCIGQYDPETGEIISNGKRGRPRKEDDAGRSTPSILINNENRIDDTIISAVTDFSVKLKNIEAKYNTLAVELHELNNEISGLMKQIGK